MIKFLGERILHTENAYIESIFASNKQWKCIIISNLALFLLKLNKMCKFFKSYEESLHLGACKPVKYVRNYVVFWKNLHSWQKIYTTAGRGGRDKFQVCLRPFSVFVFWHFSFGQFYPLKKDLKVLKNANRQKNALSSDKNEIKCQSPHCWGKFQL